MEEQTQSGFPRRILASSIAIAIALAGISVREPVSAQSLNAVDRDRGNTMLKVLKNEIKKNYYDPTFRGIDLEAR